MFLNFQNSYFLLNSLYRVFLVYFSFKFVSDNITNNINTNISLFFLDQYIGNLLRRDMYFAYLDYLENLYADCNWPVQAAKVPIAVRSFKIFNYIFKKLHLNHDKLFKTYCFSFKRQSMEIYIQVFLTLLFQQYYNCMYILCLDCHLCILIKRSTLFFLRNIN